MSVASLLTRTLRSLGFDRVSTRALGYDGAGGGRRLRHAGEMPLPLAAQIASRMPLARRARYLVGSNGYAAAGVSAWESALVGSGIKPQSAHPVPEVRTRINATFNAWTRNADADGLLDFYGLQALAARRLATDGEVFSVFTHADDELRLRMMDGEQVNGAYHTELAYGSRVVAGIEFDQAGRRTAIHAWKQRPGLPVAITLELIRIPIADVCHLFKLETPGQVRGVSWFAPVLLRLVDLDAAHDAQLMRQKVAALLTGYVISPDNGAAGFEGRPEDDGAIDSGLEPGTLKVLRPGQDVRFSDPARVGREVIEFLEITAAEVAAGLGVPYEQLTTDLRRVNYSSIRAELVEFRRRVEAIQFNVLIHQFCDPVWRRWITTEILSGRLDAPGFERDPEPYLSANWLPPKTHWVDPLKDAEGEVVAIEAGLMSRRQAVAARGYDLEQLDKEIAEDRANAKSLGLDFSQPPAPPARVPASSPDGDTD